jgi:hypothetical protein
MSDAVSHLRVLDGGGEGPDPPDPNRPLDAHEYFEVFTQGHEASPERLHATYRDKHKRRKGKQDSNFSSFARDLSQVVSAIADRTARDEIARLLSTVKLRSHLSDIVIWDDGRPRRMHLWPDGSQWGDVPPMNVYYCDSPAQTYTVCGIRVTNHFWYMRATRGEWAQHSEFFQKALGTKDDDSQRLMNHEYEAARRICPGCAAASASFADCLPEDAKAPPDWWLAPVRVLAAEQIATKLNTDHILSPAQLRREVDKAYRIAVRDWAAQRLRIDGESALRRLFGRHVESPRAGTPRSVFSEYDRLEQASLRAAKRKPHELLTETEWRRLLTPYLPVGSSPGPEDNGGLVYGADVQFRSDVEERLGALITKAAARTKLST